MLSFTQKHPVYCRAKPSVPCTQPVVPAIGACLPLTTPACVESPDCVWPFQCGQSVSRRPGGCYEALTHKHLPLSAGNFSMSLAAL